MTNEQGLLDEYKRIRGGKSAEEKLTGFLYFCNTYAFIEDKDTHQFVKFVPYDCQIDIIKAVIKGEWLAILKARRIGITWLFVVYAVWLCVFHSNRSVLVMNQGKEYAYEFIDRVRQVIQRLPAYLQPQIPVDNAAELKLGGQLHGSSIRALAATKKAAHSLAADLVLMDEAGHMEYCGVCRSAAQPTVETSHGVMVLLTTSSGPNGDFYDVYKAAVEGPTKYRAVFYDWRARPNRTEGWYEKEKADNAADPLYMKRNYPETWEEAFEAATGRVYPCFRNKAPYVINLPVPDAANHYRAIDWGGVDAFVCLWMVEVPGDKGALTVSPLCRNLIRELLAYQYDDHGYPKDADNHSPDALRYAVCSFGSNGLRGHVHVYRELYVPNSASLGLSVVDLGNKVKQLSGSETYRASVADRSRPDSIMLFQQMGIKCFGHRSLRSGVRTEIEQGIDRVNALVVSSDRPDVALPDHAPARIPNHYCPLPTIRTLTRRWGG